MHELALNLSLDAQARAGTHGGGTSPDLPLPTDPHGGRAAGRGDDQGLLFQRDAQACTDELRRVGQQDRGTGVPSNGEGG